MTELVQVTGQNADQFAPLALPSARAKLADRLGNPVYLAYGIEEASRPIGLGIAYMNHEYKSASVTHLFVRPRLRRQRHGMTLMQTLMNSLREQAIETLWIEYRGKLRYCVDPLLAKSGWDDPGIQHELVSIPTPAWRTMRWMERNFTLPDGMSFISWEDITPEEHQHLQAWVKAQTDELSGVNPYQSLVLPPARLNSVALRYNGSIIGWMITMRPMPDLIRYEQWYVMPEFRDTLVSAVLLRESIMRQVNAFEETGTPGQSLFRYRPDNAPMRRFVEKRLAPYGLLDSEMRARCDLT